MPSKITIHILTPVAATASPRNLTDIENLKGSDTEITHSVLDHGPPSIECEVDEALAVPDTIKRAIEAERDGASAIVIDCMGDPGLKPAREAVSIPVIGPAETSMHLAAMLGQTFSVVTVLDSVKPMFVNAARLYGVYDRLASVRVVSVPVLEIEERRAEVQELLAVEALKAVENDGADVVVLGCTGFLGCAEAVKRHLAEHGHDVPVIDPIPAAFCVAEALVKSGLSHSKKTYAFPRAKAYVGYDIADAKRN